MARFLFAVFEYLLWIQGFLLIAGVAQILPLYRSGKAFGTSFHVVLAVFCVAGVCALGAALAMTFRWRIARSLVLATSIANLLLPPFGWLPSSLGFYLIYSSAGRMYLRERAKIPAAQPAAVQSKGLYVATAVQCLLIAIGLHGLHKLAKSHHAETLGVIPSILIFGAILFTLTVVHELGHIGAASLTRTVVPTGILISRFAYMRRGEGWRFEKLSGGAWVRGFAFFAASDLTNLRPDLIQSISGGPLASLLAGLLGLAACLAGYDWGWGRWAQVAGFLAILGICDFVINLIPFPTEANYTDGARILQLLRRTKEGEAHLACAYTGFSETTTLRPKDWDLSELALIRELSNQPDDGHLAYNLYAHHLDNGEPGLAEPYLRRMIEAIQCAPSHVSSGAFSREAAYFTARFHKDATAARTWLEFPVQGLRAENLAEARALAAVLCAEHRWHEARQTLDHALAAAAANKPNGWHLFELARFAEIRESLEHPTPPSLPSLAGAIAGSEAGDLAPTPFAH